MHGSLILYTIHCTHLYTYRSILYSLYPCGLFFVTRRKPLNLRIYVQGWTYHVPIVVPVRPPGGHLENLLRGAKLRGHQSKSVCLVCLHINLIRGGQGGGGGLLSFAPSLKEALILSCCSAPYTLILAIYAAILSYFTNAMVDLHYCGCTVI